MFNLNKEKRIASRIENALNKRGFIVDIRAAKNSKSLYLKLDNGACPGIRISDHKKSLKNRTKYKFNVIKDYKGNKVEYYNGQFNKFYNYNSIGKLISDIEVERSNIIIKYGYSNYRNIRDKENNNYYMKNVA